MTALSPCPLLTNISAIGFISKDIESRHKTFLNGVLFTLGGMCSYTILGLIIIRLLVKGASTYAVQKAISSYGELLIAPIMVVIGLAILFAHKINIGKINIGGEGLQRRARRGGWGGPIRPRVLPHQRPFLFRHAHASRGRYGRRVSAPPALCCRNGTARTDHCMDHRIQHEPARTILSEHAASTTMVHKNRRTGIYRYRHLLRLHLLFLTVLVRTFLIMFLFASNIKNGRHF